MAFIPVEETSSEWNEYVDSAARKGAEDLQVELRKLEEKEKSIARS